MSRKVWSIHASEEASSMIEPVIFKVKVEDESLLRVSDDFIHDQGIKSVSTTREKSQLPCAKTRPSCALQASEFGR